MAPHRILNVLDEKNGQERVDNLLTCFKNITWNQAEKIRKEVLKIFKKQTSKLQNKPQNCQFWIITLNLLMKKYQGYNKLDNDPLYIDVNSNHLPNITKSLPNNIAKQINKLPLDEHVFNNIKDLYDNALTNSGYK